MKLTEQQLNRLEYCKQILINNYVQYEFYKILHEALKQKCESCGRDLE